MMDAEKPAMETVEEPRPIELRGRRPRARAVTVGRLNDRAKVSEPESRYRVMIELGIFDNEAAARKFVEDHCQGQIGVFVVPEHQRERPAVLLGVDSFTLEPLAS